MKFGEIVRSKITKTALAFLILFSFVARDSFASTLHLSKNNGIVASGSTFSVDIVLDTNNESVNGVSAFLSYPTDKLEVAGISHNNGFFSIIAEESATDGVIKISKGSFTGEIGNVTIATINF